jgi:hypothetical protein
MPCASATADDRPRWHFRPARLAPGAIVAGAMLFAMPTPPAHAADTVCPPDLGAVVVDGDLLVVAICEIEGTVVQGDVQIFAGGALKATDATIRGDIEGLLADSLTLFDSIVDGNVELENFVGVLTRISLSRIDGNLALRDNWSRLELQDNLIDGNVDFRRNSGGVVIIDNVIDGNLACRGNDPAPVGSGNLVSGNRQGQCANLRPGGIDDGGDDPDSGDTTVPGSSPGDSGPPALAPENPPSGDAGDPPAGDSPGTVAEETSSGNGSTGSGTLVLNPQPSGGGAALGLTDLLMLVLLLLSLHIRALTPSPQPRRG